MKRAGRRLFAVALLGIAAAAPSFAREPVILILSGGGARGAAHVGVLKVLEEQHVAVDAVVGTSMGALVGGLWAAGVPAAEIERTMLDADWNDLFDGRSDRSLQSYRIKEEERDFRVHGQLRLDGFSPRLPRGAISDRKVRALLRDRTGAVAAVTDFRELPIPFRAIATDLETGEAVILDSGDLVSAIRASMAVPGIFAPVTIDGRHLVDGGVSQNLPVEIARRDGAARLIAVDIASPPLPWDELGNAASVLNQAFTLLMARENERQVELLDAGDLLIRPALGTFSSAAFGEAEDAIAIGEAAAREQVGRLAAFAVSPEAYAALEASRRRAGLDGRKVANVIVDGPDSAVARAARRSLERAKGRPVDAAELRTVVERARATGRFESVDLVVVPAGEGESDLRLRLDPIEDGLDSLRFGMRLFDDFSGGTDFDLGARYVGRGLFDGAIELRADLRLGERQQAVLDLYRGVGARHALFVETSGGFREEPFAIYLPDLAILRLRRRDLFARVDLGAALGTWGEIRAGVEQNWSRLRRGSDRSDLSDIDWDETLAVGRFGVDTFDNATFPARGTFATLEGVHVLESDFPEAGVTSATADWNLAGSLGENRWLVGFEGADVLDGEPEFPRVSAGGLFRMSGFAEGELRGSRFALGRLRLSRRLGGVAARNPVYAGLSLELGRIAPFDQPLALDDASWNGSLHFGVDSLVGPIFVYVGFAEGGRRSWGFTLGGRFF